ncbi:MAG: glycine dehydrogenase (aminomethyl-transferring), partial [Akkermansiaceae bacterium]|nr:glycine dehydrogenase (aminomethyl-transferring) [Akkermansiaceae bacterium]
MYAVYHGPRGLREIANRVHGLTGRLVDGLRKAGVEPEGEHFFDTITITLEGRAEEFLRAAEDRGYNLRSLDGGRIGIALDETATTDDVNALLQCLELVPGDGTAEGIPAGMRRQSTFLDEEVFHRYHSETEMMRYLRRLEGKDLALNESMISLGSCTMKLNAASEMIPVTWAEVGTIHP